MIKVIPAMIVLFAFEGMASALLTGRGPDEEEDEDLMLWAAGETAKAVAGSVPIVRDIASAFSGFGGGGSYATATEAPFRLMQGAQKLTFGEDYSARSAIKDITAGAGVLTRMPTIQVERFITATFEKDMSVRHDFNPLDLAMGRRD